MMILIYNEKGAAEYLDVKPQTLSIWRMNGVGPNYYKFGRNVRYSGADLRKYRENNIVDTSTERKNPKDNQKVSQEKKSESTSETQLMKFPTDEIIPNPILVALVNEDIYLINGAWIFYYHLLYSVNQHLICIFKGHLFPYIMGFLDWS